MPPEQARSLLIKPASGDCNLHCTYCFYHDRPDDPYKTQKHHRMSPEVLDTLIRQGMQLNRTNAAFGWQGGEPTLCGLDFFKQVVKLQKKYGSRGQVVSNGLQTNGLLLNAEWAQFLREYNFLLGVSMDGPARFHDAYRVYTNGDPSHERVMATLKLLSEYEVQYNVLTVINSLNASHAREMYDYMVTNGFYYLQFIPCVEVDPVSGQITDFSVSPEQFGDFLCEMFDCWYNDGEPETSIRDFEAIAAVYLGQQAPMCCYQEQCGGYLVVEYNGDVYPCDFLVRDDLYMGNIMEMPLNDIFETQKMRHFSAQKAVPRPECLACPWLMLCNQGCYRFLNLDGSRQHYLCRAYKRFFTHAHSRLSQLRDRIMVNQGLNPKLAPHILGEIGRNDPCPCGSGLKYKACCGKNAH